MYHAAVVKLCRKLREAVVAAGCPRKGILPMQAALRALQPAPEVLTPLHAEHFLL
jgi:COP9 signalosome complex subunit 3